MSKAKTGLKFAHLRSEHAAIIDRWSAHWNIGTTSQTVVRMIEKFDAAHDRAEAAEKLNRMLLDRLHERAEVVARIDRADADLAAVEKELVAIAKQARRDPRQLRLDT